MNVSGVKCSAVCSIGAFISSCISSLLTPKQKPCCRLRLETPPGRIRPCPSALLGVSPIPPLSLPPLGLTPDALQNRAARCNDNSIYVMAGLSVTQASFSTGRTQNPRVNWLFFDNALPYVSVSFISGSRSPCVYFYMCVPEPTWAGGGDIPKPKSSL